MSILLTDHTVLPVISDPRLKIVLIPAYKYWLAPL